VLAVRIGSMRGMETDSLKRGRRIDRLRLIVVDFAFQAADRDAVERLHGPARRSAPAMRIRL